MPTGPVGPIGPSFPLDPAGPGCPDGANKIHSELSKLGSVCDCVVVRETYVLLSICETATVFGG